MSDGSTIVKQRQLAIRRELDRRNIALKVVSLDSGVPYSSLLSYFPEPGGRDPAQMPTGVLFLLCGHVPDDLLSLMLPEGRQIVRAPEELNHDEIAELAEDLVRTKMAAHHPDSPAGREISPCEDSALKGKVARLRAA